MTIEEAINYAEGKAAQLKEKMERFESWYGDYVMYSTELEFVSQAITALRAQQENLTKVSQGFSQDQVNAPLTLDDLRRMDGEPVWVVVLDFSAEWRILECVDTRSQEKTVLFRDGSHEPLTEYGKEWLAYRHKPKEQIE